MLSAHDCKRLVNKFLTPKQSIGKNICTPFPGLALTLFFTYSPIHLYTYSPIHLFTYSPIHLILFWITEIEFFFYVNYVGIEPAFEYITLIQYITRG